MKEIKEWNLSNYFCKAAAGTHSHSSICCTRLQQENSQTNLQQKSSVVGVGRRVGRWCKILECEILASGEFSQASNKQLRTAVLMKTELDLTSTGQMLCYTNPRLDWMYF